MSDSIYVSKEVCACISAENPSYCSFCTAAGQVMICYNNSNEWALQGSGYIDLSMNQNQNLYINLYSNENYKIIYQYQLYPNFSKHYKQLSDTFYKFETNDDYIVGLSFSSIEEAKNFETAVINQSKRVKKKLFAKSPRDSSKGSIDSLIVTSGIQSPLNDSLEARGLSKDDISSGKIDTATLMEIISEADQPLDQKSSPKSVPTRSSTLYTPQKYKKNAITDKIKFFNSFDVDKNNNIVCENIKAPINIINNNDNNNNNNVQSTTTDYVSEASYETPEETPKESDIKLNEQENNISPIVDKLDNNNNNNDGDAANSPNKHPTRYSRGQRGRSNSTVIMKDGQFFINEFQVKPPPKEKPPPPSTPPPITARRIPKIKTTKGRSGTVLPMKKSPLAI